MIDRQWNLTNLPPFKHKDVAEFAYLAFQLAKEEKIRLGKPSDFMSNFIVYRGGSTKSTSGRKGFTRRNQSTPTPINLYFANIERTVSNITSRAPIGEVIDMDGNHDEVEDILSMKIQKWWKDTSQQAKTKTTARLMEIYGITIEKPIRNPQTNDPDIVVTDPFAFFPAPGNWENMSEEAPYICYVYQGSVDKIEADYKVQGVAEEDTYELLGLQREEIKGYNSVPNDSIGNYKDPMTPHNGTGQTATGSTSSHFTRKGIIIEVWIRDEGTKTDTAKEVAIDDWGYPIVDASGNPVYKTTSSTSRRCPDGIRKITITKSKDDPGWMVIDDSPNPNINYRHLDYGDDVTHTYPWGRLPVYMANSYKDGVSIWGFAASEQVGDLINKINLIVSKLIAYVINVMAPPLIVQRNCGITREMIDNSLKGTGRTVLMPSIPNARIEFMSIPNLPSSFFQVLDLIVRFFDRVYQIEDADRGVNPTGVIAASAIIALQERNQVLMQTKTASIDYLAEQRTKWAIGLEQNWGIEEDSVDIAGERTPFRMVNFINRKFNYIVESGSTTPRTSLQIQEMAKWLFEVKAIGQRGLLEAVKWPNLKEEIKRTAESQLDQALQILIDSGLPEEFAIQLKEAISQMQLNAETTSGVNGGHQPAQPKSLTPPTSNIQAGV